MARKKRKGGGKAKGNHFERLICVRLSAWWSDGLSNNKDVREDIFWRATTSGARATTRAKVGKKTAGSCGDITAIDPIGNPFLKIFTVELKRGAGHGNPDDLIDCLETDCVRPFEKALQQAIQAYKEARSMTWLLICQRDRKIPMVYMSAKFYRDYFISDLCNFQRLEKRLVTNAKYRFRMNLPDKTKAWISIVGIPLDDFLGYGFPPHIQHLSSGFHPH